jgi:hypothetical protein
VNSLRERKQDWETGPWQLYWGETVGRREPCCKMRLGCLPNKWEKRFACGLNCEPFCSVKRPPLTSYFPALPSNLCVSSSIFQTGHREWTTRLSATKLVATIPEFPIQEVKELITRFCHIKQGLLFLWIGLQSPV